MIGFIGVSYENAEDFIKTLVSACNVRTQAM
jgi:hypothetical protein